MPRYRVIVALPEFTTTPIRGTSRTERNVARFVDSAARSFVIEARGPDAAERVARERVEANKMRIRSVSHGPDNVVRVLVVGGQS